VFAENKRPGHAANAAQIYVVGPKGHNRDLSASEFLAKVLFGLARSARRVVSCDGVNIVDIEADRRARARPGANHGVLGPIL